MQHITFSQALRKFGLEAESRLPGNSFGEWRTIMKVHCVIALATLAGYYVENEYSISKHMRELEKQGSKVTMTALLAL